MTSSLLDVCCASLAADGLAALADVRCVPGVRVALAGDRVWVRWEAGDEQVLRRVLPIPGVRLYLLRNNDWFRHGHSLPAFEVPADLDYRTLYEVLTPARVQPIAPPAWNGQPVTFVLVPDDRPRPTTALRCGLDVLAAWADKMPEARLTALRSARFQGQVLVLGARLPLLPGAERFWGTHALVPVGWRLEPSLPESAVQQALALSADQLLLMRADSSEILSLEVFRPLTRAGLRLACGEVSR